MRFFLILFILASLSIHSQAVELNRSHAIAMHGQAKMAADFQHFEYANPNAKKQGSLRLGLQGSFDSLNAYISKGHAADYLHLIYDTLTVHSLDEPFTEYGLLAEIVEWPDDRSFVQYTLRKEARFHDGQAITSEDVKFSFELLMQYGSPGFKAYYADVESVEIISPQQVRFNFRDNDNAELVLIVGQLPVLPKHFWQDKAFDKANLTLPLGSGPYQIDKVNPGKTISYQRVKNYWAKDLAVNRGMYNFDTIEIDYYRDNTVLLEALKANKYDLRLENIAKQWATAYIGPAIDSGKLKTLSIKHNNPVGLQSFVFNMRKSKFDNSHVRQAIALAFDFEWTNKALFYNSYQRSQSFYTNSELASSGLPSKQELALLNPLKEHIPSSVFTHEFKLPVTDASGNNRQQLRQAMQLLEKAGWEIKQGKLSNERGENFTIEFLVYDNSFEKVINPFIQNLKRLGIDASIRQVEISQYINRMREFNFDITTMVYPQSLSPGNEQADYFSSASADIPGSRNYGGIKNSAIDSLVKSVIQAKSRDELITATHALDRVLLHHWYVIPQYYIDSFRVAYWDKFARPDVAPKYDAGFNQAILTWWEK